MQTQGTLPDIRKTVILRAPIDKAWQAVATSEGIAGWWMANTFEPIVGHEFVLHTGQFGDSPCKVKEIVPPNRLSFDWGKDWNLTFELTKIDEATTEFTLIHSGWKADALTEFGQPHTIIRGIMEGGWGDLGRLAKYVEE